MTMRIAFICTSNLWGSALAEHTTRALLRDWGVDGEQVQVTSAGVRAQVGAPLPAVTQLVLAERGIDASGHAARWMTPELLAAGDLVLTMGAVQREAALALHPRGLRSTFTVREAAALLQGLPPVVAPVAPEEGRHARAVVATLAGARRFRVAPSGVDDLPDLLADDVRAVRALAEQLTRDVSALLRALVLPEFAARATTPARMVVAPPVSAVA